jgi:nucleotide-binding universal stress UspA family protein
MTSYNTVLVGVDGSEVANAALAFAADEAARRGARLVVAYAGPTASTHPDSEVHTLGEVICKEANAAVAARHPLLDCQVVQRDADAAQLLVELSAAADLLVVGTHRTGRLRGWVLGSVSQHVAAHASCPVATITTMPTHPSGPIVLGASGSAGGLAALRFACSEARVRGVAVHAVRSITTEDWMLSGPGSATVLGPDVLQDVAQAQLDKVLAAAKELAPDVEVTGVVALASPFVDLLKASAGASMLVIGMRRDQHAVLPRLGPVAAWLLHQADCPLVVVGHRE